LFVHLPRQSKRLRLGKNCGGLWDDHPQHCQEAV
jgi:hypothetical protein